MVVELAQTSALPSHSHQNTAVLRRVFETLTAESCPRQANFHMHTVCSDGRLEPEILIQQAIDIGLSDLAITDHHSINGYRRAARWLQRQHMLRSLSPSNKMRPFPTLWIGVEVNAQLLDNEVHLLCYAFDSAHDAMQSYFQGSAVKGQAYQAQQVITTTHDAGGLVVLAHPNRYRRSPAELIAEAARLEIDGVETFYAYDNPSPWRPSPQTTELIHQLGTQYGLLHTCGTDTHGLSLLQRL